MSSNPIPMTHEDLMLEEEIEREFSIVCDSTIPMPQRKDAMYRMTELVKQRNDELIEKMERDKGLKNEVV